MDLFHILILSSESFALNALLTSYQPFLISRMMPSKPV